MNDCPWLVQPSSLGRVFKMARTVKPGDVIVLRASDLMTQQVTVREVRTVEKVDGRSYVALYLYEYGSPHEYAWDESVEYRP